MYIYWVSQKHVLATVCLFSFVCFFFKLATFIM